MEKRLYRSRNKKVVAGIAGGLGDYLDVDPVIIRIIIVLITIFHGVGLLIYIIMWIVIPEEQYDTSKKSAEPLYAEDTGQKTESNFAEGTNTSSQPEKSSNGRIIFGVILIFSIKLRNHHESITTVLGIFLYHIWNTLFSCKIFNFLY